ncbi:hypothetical protein [Bacterioplanoides pacificum]|uniref:Uncharacterized protein n=1 Tax=Bacterioplanoides pacificum TaxID=1171596 RepID=A0ABV7VVE1_9GAMM
MLIENSSDLIQSVEQAQLPSGKPADLATLVNGQVLVVSEDALAVYRSVADVSDELGNGLRASVSIPSAYTLPVQTQAFIQEHRAGYVGLSDGRVLLITLNDVQMFPSKQDALRNQNEVVRLPLG